MELKFYWILLSFNFKIFFYPEFEDLMNFEKLSLKLNLKTTNRKLIEIFNINEFLISKSI